VQKFSRKKLLYTKATISFVFLVGQERKGKSLVSTHRQRLDRKKFQFVALEAKTGFRLWGRNFLEKKRDRTPSFCRI